MAQLQQKTKELQTSKSIVALIAQNFGGQHSKKKVKRKTNKKLVKKQSPKDILQKQIKSLNHVVCYTYINI